MCRSRLGNAASPVLAHSAGLTLFGRRAVVSPLGRVEYGGDPVDALRLGRSAVDWSSTADRISWHRRLTSTFCRPILMRARLFQLDSFTTQRFRGNPAAVVLLDAFPADAVMLAIAAENNLAETAFLVPSGDAYSLRWFTPAVEVPLCGHATLASAAVVMERLQPARERVVFHSASGPLPVTRTGGSYCLDFPTRPSQVIAVPDDVSAALGVVPQAVLINPFNYLAVLGDEAVLRSLVPDMARVAALDRPGLIVTTAGSGGYDFVSRYFAPAKGVPEDPVTGGAHCSLAPYWAQRLGKKEFRAYQASSRGGELRCRVAGDRVELEGSCVFYLEGEIKF